MPAPSRFRLLACFCFLTVSVAGATRAQQVANGSFETNNLANSSTGYLYGSQAGTAGPLASPWTFSNNMGAGIARAATGTSGFGVNGAVADGAAFAFIRNSTTDTNYVGGVISQDVTFTTGGTYLLSFAEAARTGSNSGTITFGVTVGSLTLTPGLNAGTTSNANGYLNTVTTGDAFRRVQYTFTVPGSGGTYSLRFTGDNSTSSNAAYLDNITITTVPEPATAAGAALLVAAATWKRRRVRAV